MPQYKLYKTKKGPGAIVNISQADLSESFNIVEGLISLYYEEKKEFILVENEKKRTSKKRSYKVFSGSDMKFEDIRYRNNNIIDQKVLQGIDPLYAIVNVKHLKETEKKTYVKDWDFPHRPFVKVTQTYYIYFNIINKDKAESDRLSFKERGDFFDTVLEKRDDFLKYYIS